MSRIRVSSPAEWAEACSSAFVPLSVRSTGAGFAAALSQRQLAPGVSITRVSSTASEVVRDRRTIASSPRDDLLLSLHRTGEGSVRQHERRARLGAGSAVLYDASAPYALAFSGRMSEIVLQVPRGAVAGVGNAFTDLTARTLPVGPSLHALHALAAAVRVEEPATSEADDRAVGEAMVGLLLAALRTGRSDAAAPLDSGLLLLSLRGFVDEHLADPELTPECLAAAHHVSLRLVQKLFAEDGDSPAAFIRRSRMQQAQVRLAAGEPVALAARRSGYLDVDSFARAFKKEFGITPSGAKRSYG